jgi:hypothetical protein
VELNTTYEHMSGDLSTAGDVDHVMCSVCTSKPHHLLYLLQEISLLKSLNYDRNIVQFYGARLRTGATPMMVLEYMEVWSES